MKKISQNLNKTWIVKKGDAERKDIINEFMERLNADRGKREPVSFPQVATLIKHIPTSDLYFLRSVCNQSNSFSARFWSEVRVDKGE